MSKHLFYLHVKDGRVKFVTYILPWWIQLGSYTLPIKDSKKYINHVTHFLSSANISIIPPEILNFCFINKYKYRLNFNTYFLVLLTLFDSLKVVLTSMPLMLIISSKLATLGLLKIKIFWNKGYSIKISVSIISLKEVIITLIL